MKEKWPDSQIVYVAVHKMGSRDWDTQQSLYNLEMEICRKWGVAVADVYADTDLDTREVEQAEIYSFNNLDKNGLPGANGSGTHPNFQAIEEFYVPVVSDALRNLEDHIPVIKTVLNQMIQKAKEEAAETTVFLLCRCPGRGTEFLSGCVC